MFFNGGTRFLNNSYFLSKNFVFLLRLNPILAVFLKVPIVTTVNSKPIIGCSNTLAMRVVGRFFPLKPNSLLVSPIVYVHGSDSIRGPGPFE